MSQPSGLIRRLGQLNPLVDLKLNRPEERGDFIDQGSVDFVADTPQACSRSVCGWNSVGCFFCGDGGCAQTGFELRNHACHKHDSQSFG